MISTKKVLIVVPVEDAEGELADVLRKLSEDGKSGIFICMNKPAPYRREMLERQGISTEKMFMLDTVSGELREDENTWFIPNLDSERIIKDLKIIVNKEKKDYILVESLRTLEIYEDERRVLDFLKELDRISIEHGQTIIAIITRHSNHESMNGYFDKVMEVR